MCVYDSLSRHLGLLLRYQRNESKRSSDRWDSDDLGILYLLHGLSCIKSVHFLTSNLSLFNFFVVVTSTLDLIETTPFSILNRYIAKNISLYELANEGTKLSTHAQANFARGELATALRKGPYQVNVLLGGYDAGKNGAPGSASLYYLDYFGALHKVKNGAQGYAQYFCSSIFDKECTDNMTEESAIRVVEMCINEMQTRFMLSQPNFMIKKVDKDGVSVVSFGENPADT